MWFAQQLQQQYTPRLLGLVVRCRDKSEDVTRSDCCLALFAMRFLNGLLFDKTTSRLLQLIGLW